MPDDRESGQAERGPGHQPDEALRHSEEQFESIISAVSDYAVFLLDAEGRVATWNAGAERIKGYTAGEIIGRHFSVFYPADSVAAGWPDRELELARLHGRFEDESWRVRADGTLFWANVVITTLYTPSRGVRGFLKITRDLSSRREAEEQLRQAHADLEQRVRDRTAELVEANAQLRKEVAERRRLEGELRATVARLEEQDRSKDRMIAILSHELRNPLAPIRSAADLLRSMPHAPDGERALKIIERQTAQLSRLVDDLLDMARMRRNAIGIEHRPLDLREVLNDAADAARPFLEERGLHFELRAGSQPLPVNGDAARLSQVFGNLLHNAAKFTPRGGSVTVACEATPASVVVRVTDTGAGMAPDEVGRIFEMFAQLEPNFGRQRSGLGLGLAIAQYFVELHGGTIEARSAGRGRGAEFRVSLPLQAVETPEEKAAPAPQMHAPHRKVLVVDDNIDAAEAMTMILAHLGHTVRTAFDGASAIREAETFAPDVALLDIGMPGFDGYELARRFRQMPFGQHVILVAITGWGQPEDHDRARVAGFDYHLTKPAQTDALRRILGAPRPQAFVPIGVNRG